MILCGEFLYTPRYSMSEFVSFANLMDGIVTLRNL